MGTKLDLVESGHATRVVRPEEVAALAEKHGAEVFEASAKAGEGVPAIFSAIVSHYQARGAGTAEGSAARGVNVSGGSAKGGCC